MVVGSWSYGSYSTDLCIFHWVNKDMHLWSASSIIASYPGLLVAQPNKNSGACCKALWSNTSCRLIVGEDNDLQTVSSHLMTNQEACEEIPDAEEEARDYPCYRQIGCGIHYHDSCMTTIYKPTSHAHHTFWRLGLPFGPFVDTNLQQCYQNQLACFIIQLKLRDTVKHADAYRRMSGCRGTSK